MLRVKNNITKLESVISEADWKLMAKRGQQKNFVILETNVTENSGVPIEAASAAPKGSTVENTAETKTAEEIEEEAAAAEAETAYNSKLENATSAFKKNHFKKAKKLFAELKEIKTSAYIEQKLVEIEEKGH